MTQGLTLEQLKAMGAIPHAPAVQPKRGLTLQELQAMGAVPQKPQESYGQDFVSDVSEAGRGMAESMGKRGEQFKDIAKQTWEGTINPIQTGIRTVGTAIGAGTDILGGGLIGTAKAVLPQAAEEAVGSAAQAAMQTGVGRAIGSAAQKYSEWASQNPETAKDIGAVANIASILPVEKAVEAAVKGVQGTFRGVQTAATGMADATKAAVSTAKGIGGTAKDIGTILKEKASSAARFAASTPERLEATAKGTAREAAQMAAEKPVVQKAAQSGFTAKEASTVANATPREKFVMRQMNESAKKATAGGTAKSSADVAGSYLQKRLADADAIRQEIGTKLGDAVKGLKGEVVSSKFKVLDRLKKVRGLEDLTIDNKGNLDFTNTTLSTAATKADRNAINSMWKAINGRDAYRLHQLRQEIFETLGGRKAAKVPLTATQEQGLEAIRQGLADAVEGVSPTYRTLNRQYAQIAEPMKNLRKFYRGLENAGSDILDERSGILMSRLTGKSPSAQNLKQAIAEIDDILASSGKPSPVNLQKLQDFQNLLEREYTDIVKETGFAGQTALGIKKGMGGLLEKGGEILSGIAGNTSEYRRKLIDEMLR